MKILGHTKFTCVFLPSLAPPFYRAFFPLGVVYCLCAAALSGLVFGTRTPGPFFSLGPPTPFFSIESTFLSLPYGGDRGSIPNSDLCTAGPFLFEAWICYTLVEILRPHFLVAFPLHKTGQPFSCVFLFIMSTSYQRHHAYDWSTLYIPSFVLFFFYLRLPLMNNF